MMAIASLTVKITSPEFAPEPLPSTHSILSYAYHTTTSYMI